MSSYVLPFQEIDRTKIAIVGGKGASLGLLSKIEEIRVPDGFCISTDAFKAIVKKTPSIQPLLDKLSLLKSGERDKISSISSTIRSIIEDVTIPEEISVDITSQLSRLGEKNSYAIRSSATAEDLPTASFAGQQDTFLNVIGTESILKHVAKCWASLFTERAIVYRMQNGFDHRSIHLAVVVQRMVFPQVAGILFTADPITGNRKVTSIDASFGLGEALVSGIVNADNYKVHSGRVTNKKISVKKLAVRTLKDGGTNKQEIQPEQQNNQALTDVQILQLARIGRTIETHFEAPQDIEWCLNDHEFYVVQSRPITTLYPIPEATDKENHVYVSVGHQQMMTDAIKPLGLSFYLLTTQAHMRIAGGRLFVDVTPMLGTIINVLGNSDPLIKDALTTIVERGDFVKPMADVPNANTSTAHTNYQTLEDYDPTIVTDLIKRSEIAIADLKNTIKTKSGTALFDFILEDIQHLKKFLADPQSFGVIMTGMNASTWLNEKMNAWLGEKNVADILSQAVANNVTSEMGRALLDVADLIRTYADVIAYLEQTRDDNFLEELIKYKGGKETKDAINAYLEKYGMRCIGEIDITRARWREKPITLVPLILTNIKNVEPGASKRKLEQGHREASKKEQHLLNRLASLPDGEQKAKETKRMIDLIRNLSGYREYPKYAMVSRYFVYKQALLNEAEQLVNANIIREKEDVYYLTFEEFREVIRTHKLDYELIVVRKAEHKIYEKLTPPRVITSDGEIITGAYKRENLPASAIPGLAVSSGVIEGRARVILNLQEANLEDGDILVTSFTDPSWTPLFLSIKGLVTEVGGLMTHGAVIAREYGLPAVVGVENATKLIMDKQRIRVNGTDGFVEIL